MIERCNNRSYLIGYDLDMDLFNRFDLEVYDIVPVRSAFVISTNKGNKVLKKIEYTKNELKFIYDGLQYIKNKFNRIMDFEKTIDNEIYTIWNDEMYCIMDLIDGNECDFNNPIHLNIAAKGIGELHGAAEGFKSDMYSKYMNGKLIDNFKRRIQEIIFFKNIANIHECKNEFDELFLKNANYYIDQINKSVKLLESSSYYRLCSEEDKVLMCHHDLAHHNILIKDEKAYFIDFDYAIIDLKVHDLCNFINKVLKNFAFDVDKAESILNNYCSSNDLDKRELEVLYGMMIFPQDFYSISKGYYTKTKDWDEEVFIDRMKKKIEYKEYREEFLEELKKVI